MNGLWVGSAAGQFRFMHKRLVLLEPRGEGDEEKAHGRRIKHGGQHSPERLVFWGLLINGTLLPTLQY